MSALVRGVDISSWNHPGNRPIDFEKVRAAGITFVMVKATQGDSYVSPWLKEDLDGAALAGLLVGAYHFYEVGPEPSAQAEHFTASLVGHVLELGAWLDWETGPMTPYEAANLVGQFVTHAEEVRKPVGLYVDESWRSILKEANYTPSRWWAAAWDAPTAPPGAFLWQTGTEAVDGIEGEVDADRLLVTRGINVPSSPVAPRPSEAPRTPQDVTEAPEAHSEPVSDPEPAAVESGTPSTP